MSTRAVYTFTDGTDTFHVYKHHDGYPTGAAQWIARALHLAWPLPRFEPDEFAASFIAVNKDSAGDVRLTTGAEAHGDIAYHYVISAHGTELLVHANSIDTRQEMLIFAGTLDEFKAWAEKREL